MSSDNTLHAVEFRIDDSLVRRLVDAQCPQWSHLPARRVRTTGTDNVVYRLGDQLLVRLPRTAEASLRTLKEHRWLPRCAKLPVRIPVPIATGSPCSEYPAAWSVLPWLPGNVAGDSRNPLDEPSVAQQLAEFLLSMRKINAEIGVVDELLPGTHNFFRGVPLIDRDKEVRIALSQLSDSMNTEGATRAWDAILKVAPWENRPVLIHGDLLPANILVQQRRITAIIDFGGMGIGDPACDLIPAWGLFSKSGREIFKRLIEPDQNTWLRGQGWALSIGLIALPYYRQTNPAFARLAECLIHETVRDFQSAT